MGRLDNGRQIRRDEARLFDHKTSQFSSFFRHALNGFLNVCLAEDRSIIGKTSLPSNQHDGSRVYLLVLALVLCLPSAGWSQVAQPSEYQIKAAFLFNFAKFVEWPPQAFANQDSPMVIGVLGENVFGDSLERAVRNKAINNHSLQFRVYHSLDEITNCHVLFISSSEEARYGKILDALNGLNVLTVSESDHFIDSGGMINFVLEDKRIRFQINNQAAQKAGLKISSKLLSLAISNR